MTDTPAPVSWPEDPSPSPAPGATDPQGAPRLALLDVGHGNCSVLYDPAGISIIDAPAVQVLTETLPPKGTALSMVVVSHAHGDHAKAVPFVLSNYEVGSLYMNADSTQDAEFMEAIGVVLRTLRKENKKTRGPLNVHEGLQDELCRGEVRVEVLWPLRDNAHRGVGGADLEGRPITPNGSSVVVRLSPRRGGQSILLPGDLDANGLANLIDNKIDLTANVLVYPHHGGGSDTPDKDDAGFAERLCAAVQPDLIVFSIGRHQYRTPRPKVIEGIRRAFPNVRIACTQLSEHCASALPNSNTTHWNKRPAMGKAERKCCFGTFALGFHETQIPNSEIGAHEDHITKHTLSPLCRKRFEAQPVVIPISPVG